MFQSSNDDGGGRTPGIIASLSRIEPPSSCEHEAHLCYLLN